MRAVMTSREEWFLIISYLEILLICVVTILILIAGYVCLRIRAFHSNLIGIITILFFQAIIAMFLRAVILIYGLDKPGFCYNEAEIWRSSLKLVDFACYTARISLFSCFGTIVFERFYACIRIATYEKTQNFKWIAGSLVYGLSMGVVCSYFILYAQIVAAEIFANFALLECHCCIEHCHRSLKSSLRLLIWVSDNINIVFLVGLAEIANLNGFCFFFFVHWWNLKRYKRSIWDSSYSLSMRFQLSENIRISLCMKRVIVFMSVCNFFTLFTYASSYFSHDALINQIAKACFNYTLIAYSIGLISIGVYTIPAYKYKVISLAQKCLKYLKQNRVGPEKYAVSEKPDLRHLRNLEGGLIMFDARANVTMGELYFSQLQKSWNV